MSTILLPNIDDSILLTLNESQENFVKNMVFYNAMVLYKKNKLSLGKAAQIAGMDKLDFIKRLGEEEIAIFDYEQDNNLVQAQKLLGAEYHYVPTNKTDQELLAEALTEKYL